MFDLVFDLLSSPEAWTWFALASFVIGVAGFLLAPFISRRQLHRVPAAQRAYADSLGIRAFRIMGLACIVEAAVSLLFEFRMLPPIATLLGFLLIIISWFPLRRRADLEQLSSSEEHADVSQAR